MEVETSMAPVRAAVCRVETDITVEDLMHVRGVVEAAKRAIKELADELEQRTCAWIESNGEFEIGDVHYFVGPTKVVRCMNLRGTVEAALVATGGDVDTFTELLSTNAFKPATTRKMIAPESYERLFSHTVKMDLKGRPVKGLQVVNKQFVK